VQSSRSPPVSSYKTLSIKTQFKDIKIISWTQFKHIKVERTQYSITALAKLNTAVEHILFSSPHPTNLVGFISSTLTLSCNENSLQKGFYRTPAAHTLVHLNIGIIKIKN